MLVVPPDLVDSALTYIDSLPLETMTHSITSPEKVLLRRKAETRDPALHECLCGDNFYAFVNVRTYAM